MTPFARNRLAACVVLACSSSYSYAAQTNDYNEIEEVVAVASPIKDSQKAAIMAKQSASNFVDIVAADTIGRFPDQNLADSLGRVPGLAIERDQGQARYINFRGAPFRYTTIAIDGMTIPGAENGRIPRFDSFPSVITSRLSANKAIMPDMPGESIAGFINIETFNPFDVEGFSLATDVGLGNQALGDGDISKFSVRTSWSGENVGISLFASQNSREQITDNREFDLEQVDSELVVNELDMRSYKVKREDEAYGGRFEYRPSDSMNRFFFSTLYSKFQDHEERNQYVFDFAGGAEAAGSNLAAGETGTGLAMVSRSLEYGLYENSTWTSTLGADLQLGDWFLEARTNFTKTENDVFLPLPYSLYGAAVASYDVSDINDPLVTLAPGTSLNDIDYGYEMLLVYGSALSIDSLQFKLDAETDFAFAGLNNTFKMGLGHDQREAQGYGTNGGMASLYGIDPSDYVTDQAWHTDFTNSINGTYYDNKQLRADLESASGGLTVTPDNASKINIDENITTAYAMVTNQFKWGSLVSGVRIESTDYTSSGPEGEHSDTFTEVLPSVNLNVDLSDQVKFRAALSTGMSRPTYNEWRASASIDTTEQTISGGNPFLKAESSYGADMSLEWYAGDASLVAVGAFYRHIDDVIYADTTYVDAGNYISEFAGEQWKYTGFVNGDEGHFQGIELNFIGQASDFISESWDGFGFSANLTLLDSEFTTLSGSNFSLPGTSDMIFNSSVYYENDLFSARLNYQYRDDWLSTTENDSMGEYWAAQTRLDLSLSYTLAEPVYGSDVSFYANINNLTDEIDVRYIGTEATPNQIERYGRRYMAGVRINF